MTARVIAYMRQFTTNGWMCAREIKDAQRNRGGVIATVKLPLQLRGGTHTNWFTASSLPPVKDALG